MAILHLENVFYAYEKSASPVLRGVTADFEAGKMYAVIGRSGAGKTTLLSLIAGLDVCTGGAIFYKGENLNSINRDKYRSSSIGVVFQSCNLLPGATAVENVVLAMNLSGDPSGGKKAAAYSLLAKVGIDRETASRKILKLSGGEQQRVGIARALCHSHELLIADEPTGNLDESNENAIMEILSGLTRNENRCVIIVTHSHKVASCADVVLGMSGGGLTTLNEKNHKDRKDEGEKP